jgi:hypothetical protein
VPIKEPRIVVPDRPEPPMKIGGGLSGLSTNARELILHPTRRPLRVGTGHRREGWFPLMPATA